MSTPPKALWLARAEQRVLDVLATESAATKRELEARLSEPAGGIHPHILTTTLRRLISRDAIILSPPTPTRGGREIEVYHLPIVEGVNKTLIDDASARKRLLQTRYMSFALTSARHEQGFIGPAGNKALHMALTSPECAGLYALVKPDGGDVTHLFGQPVPVGPLDSAAGAYAQKGGVPHRPVTVLFEVKNLRHWIYPTSEELYQLLVKAAHLQAANPGELIVPVLVTRRRHFWTLEMGVDLGFFTIEIHDQPMLRSADVSEEAFEEVRAGLGYDTLRWLDVPPPRLLLALRDGLPPYLLQTAERWQSHGSSLVEHYEILRDDELSANDRSDALADLGRAASTLPDMALRWRPTARFEEEEEEEEEEDFDGPEDYDIDDEG